MRSLNAAVSSHPFLSALLLLLLLASGLAAGSSRAAEPESFRAVVPSEAGLIRGEGGVLRTAVGTLRTAGRSGASPFSQVGDLDFGSFSIQSLASDLDLRTHPFRIFLETPTGRLFAFGELVNRLRRVDPLSGRPLRFDAPEGATCPTGAEEGCLVGAIFSAQPATEFPRVPLGAPEVPPFDERLLTLYCESSAGIFGASPFPCGPNPRVTAAGIHLGAGFSNLVTGSNPGQGVLFGLMDSTLIAPMGATGSQARLRNAFVAANADISGDGTFSAIEDLPLVRVFDDADICTRALADPSNPAFSNVLGDCATSGNDPDGPDAISAGLISTDPINNGIIADALHGKLSDPQEALLGCGSFYGPLCDADGLDFRVASAAFLLQSWPEGAVADASVAQPGTAGAADTSPCVRSLGENLVVLPGCSAQLLDATDGSVENLAWSRLADGTSPSSDEAEATVAAELNDPGSPTVNVITRHPFACTVSPFDAAFAIQPGETFTQAQARRGCQLWASEGAALSWNFLMALVALSGPDPVPIPHGTAPPIPGADPDNCRFGVAVIDLGPPVQLEIVPLASEECYAPPEIDQLDITDLFRTDGCSFLRPTLCRKAREVLSLVVTELPDDPTSEPRRRWTWETGVSGVVVEATGDLAGHFGGTLHVFGPVEPVVEGAVAGANILALPSECNDGRDNDGDEAIDFPDDLACRSAFWNSETPCGLGFELALLLPALMWLRQRMRQKGAGPSGTLEAR